MRFPKPDAAELARRGVKPERAHDEDGHFAKDDPSTPNVNEAYKDGKSTAKPKAKAKAKAKKGK